MEFKRGSVLTLNGNPGQLNSVIHYLSAAFCRLKEKVLFIDTINSLNLHSSYFEGINQHYYFKNIYCVRTPLPYDLLARLNSSGRFIKKKKMSVLLINSLSLFFKDSPKRDVEPVMKNILNKIKELTEENQLITILANSQLDNEQVIIASNFLSVTNKLLEVFINGTH
ncbi:hypothetical protein HYW75_02795 [Candidatus Pacearchaeota archaeon]|nr:hypothetical protein [Candidatus Pacearchaeota archaeon]